MDSLSSIDRLFCDSFLFLPLFRLLFLASSDLLEDILPTFSFDELPASSTFGSSLTRIIIPEGNVTISPPK